MAAASDADRNLRLFNLSNDNYDAWESRLKHILYAKGCLDLLDCSFIQPLSPDEIAAINAAAAAAAANAVAAGAQPPAPPALPVTRAPGSSVNITLRRWAWGIITCSLNAEITAKVDRIQPGEVEDLLRLLRGLHYRPTVNTRSKLKRQLFAAKLEDHADLSAYVAHHCNLHARLQTLGYTVEDEDKLHFLLEGLPDDYAPIKQVINLPRSPALTWDDVVKQLTDFADNPRIPGCPTTLRSAHAPAVNTANTEVCNHYSRTGKCKYGSRCKFVHVVKPNIDNNNRRPPHQSSSTSSTTVCDYCKKRGHTAQRCFKKRRDDKRPAPSSTPSTTPTPTPTPTASAATVTNPVFESGPANPQVSFTDPLCHAVVYNVPTPKTCSTTSSPVRALLDGGANVGLVPSLRGCYNIRPCCVQVGAVGGPTTATHIVDLDFLVHAVPGTCAALALHCRNYYYVPAGDLYIIPEHQFIQSGHNISKHSNLAIISLDNAPVYCAQQSDSTSLYYFRCTLLADSRVDPDKAQVNLAEDGPSALDDPDTKVIFPDPAKFFRIPASPLRNDPFEAGNFPAVEASSNFSQVSRQSSHVPPVAAAAHAADVPNHARPAALALSSTYDAWEPVCIDTLPLDIANAYHQCDYDYSAVLPPPPPPPTSTAVTALAASVPAKSKSLAELLLWHQRLGHRNFRDVAATVGLSLPAQLPLCIPCVQGKSRRHPIGRRPAPLHEAPRPGYLLHADWCGKFPTPTRGGNQYLLVHVDDFSRYIFVILTKTMTGYHSHLLDLLRKIESHHGRENVVCQVLTDSAPAFETSIPLRQLCVRKGITQLFAPPYTQSLNGVAERTIGTIIQMARTMLLHSGMPRFFYGEAILYSVYIINHLPRSSNVRTTRSELWYGRTVPMGSHRSIRTWGCAAWKHEDHETGQHVRKFDPKATLHVLLGIDDARKCYKLATIPNFKVSYSAHVTFDEATFPCKASIPRSMSELEHSFAPLTSPSAPLASSSDPLPVPRRPRRVWAPSREALENLASAAPSSPDPVPAQPAVQHAAQPISNVATTTAATTSPSTHLPSFFYACFAATPMLAFSLLLALNATILGDLDGDPRTRAEAMSRADAPRWRAGEISEFRSHVLNGTLGPPVPLASLPSGTKAIPADLIYKVKRCGRRKARLVIKGFHMIQGRDFNFTFAPVPTATSIRILFALAAYFDFEIKQGDVSTAFLAADMDTEVYVTIPAGFNDDTSPSATRPRGTCYRLLKSIPGIPQASALWFKRCSMLLQSVGLRPTVLDPSVYVLPGKRLFVAVWVDDVFAFYSSDLAGEFKSIWTRLQALMQLDDPVDVDDCLACRVSRDRANKVVHINQSSAIRALLSRAGMSDCADAPTPVAAGFKFTKNDCPDPPAPKSEFATWYRSTLASCIYFSTWTRPDISFAVSKLCKFMHNPGPQHGVALKRLLRYLKGTMNHGLKYSSAQAPRDGVYGYFDASHADCPDTRRSTLAFVYFFFGCPISWHSKHHSYVTTSTNHSEFCAAAKAAKEAKWLENYFMCLDFPEFVHPIPTFSDSTGAISMSYNPVSQPANKHVEIADHYAREQVAQGTLTITYISTKDMLADVLTKALAAPLFVRFRDCLVAIWRSA